VIDSLDLPYVPGRMPMVLKASNKKKAQEEAEKLKDNP